QRESRYAIQPGVLLQWHWLEKFFRTAVAGSVDSGAPALGEGAASQSGAVDAGSYRMGPLPFWVALSLYASMPFFHLHTFLALTIVLIFGLFLERPSEIEFIAGVARAEGPAGVGRMVLHRRMWPEVFRGSTMRRRA